MKRLTSVILAALLGTGLSMTVTPSAFAQPERYYRTSHPYRYRYYGWRYRPYHYRYYRRYRPYRYRYYGENYRPYRYRYYRGYHQPYRYGY